MGACCRPADDEAEAISFLQQVYPNEICADGTPVSENAITTERFREYAAEECDYDPIYQTQDYYAIVLPEPSITRYETLDNAYKVEWTASDNWEKSSVILILTKQEDNWLIDNIIEEDEKGNASLLFNYTRKPIPVSDYLE